MPDDVLFSKSEAALKGGCQWLQYRDKSMGLAKRTREAIALKALCHRYNAKLIINDDLALAIASEAHGLHLGQGDGSVVNARAQLGPNAIIGVTCHDQLGLARTAVAEGASYVAFGRFFPSATKPDANSAPLSLLSAAGGLAATTVAIGGINLSNVAKVIEAGASAIAVCHSLFGCDDVEGAARSFCQYFS